MKVALGQTNPTVGDIPGNVRSMARFANEAAALGADMIVFPELSVTGYPPLDLIERGSFTEQSEAAVLHLAELTKDLPLAVVTGYVGRSHESFGKRATNSAAILHGGRVVLRQTKVLLPTYDVFDEARYFVPGEAAGAMALSRSQCGAGHLRRLPGTTRLSGHGSYIRAIPWRT